MPTPRMNALLRSFLCVVLLAVAGGALAEPAKTSLPPKTELVTIEGFPFPRQVAGLYRTMKTEYGGAGSGFSVRYEGIDDTWADIFIYDRQEDLRSGSALSHARGELLSTLSDIDTAVSKGSYQRADIVDRSEEGSFAKAHLKIAVSGKTRDSFVFITVRNGNFVKIRLTSGDRKYADRTAQRFLAEYGGALGKI